MNWLAELQSEMSRAVIQGKRSRDEWRQQPGFALYQGGYRASLLSVLRTIYPVVSALIGQEYFNRLSQSYVNSHDLQSWDLDGYGRDFPKVLASDSSQQLPAFVPQVASLEWACHDVMNMAMEQRLQASELLGNPEQLGETKLNFVAHYLLQFDCNVGELWKQHQKDMSLAQGFELKRTPEAWFICLSQNQLSLNVLNHEEYWFVLQLQSSCLGQVMSMCEQKNIEFESHLINVFQKGWLTSAR